MKMRIRHTLLRWLVDTGGIKAVCTRLDRARLIDRRFLEKLLRVSIPERTKSHFVQLQLNSSPQ